jgi:putative membrane protein
VNGGEERILVLCVDRDNDVGDVLGISTPVMGEENILRTALEYILRRPEDSDSNALFAAVQTYRELVNKGYKDRVEIALLAGETQEGVEADIKILRELDQILSKEKFTGAILVSDGPTDEAVAPLIQSRLPLISIRRVIVQQSRGVEETFVLLVNYVRKLFMEEKYRRFSLGLTGVFLIVYVFLSTLLPQFLWPIILGFTGLVLVVKGYNLDETLRGIYSSKPITFAALILSALLVLLGTIQGVSVLVQNIPKGFFAALGDMMLASIGAQLITTDLFVLAAALPIFGRIVDTFISYKPPRVSDAFALMTILISRQLLVEVAKYLSGGGDIRGVLTWSFIVLGFIVFFVSILPLERRGKG